MACPDLLILDGFEFLELKESGEAQFDHEAQETRRKYLCDWDIAYGLANRLIGGAVAAGTVFTDYVEPHRDPNRDFLFAKTVTVAGFNPIGQDSFGAIRYAKATLDVVYKVRKDDQQNGGDSSPITFLTETRTHSATTYTLPEDALLWAEGTRIGKTVGKDATAFINRPLTNITVDIQWWFDAPTDLTFESLYGSVNLQPIQFLLTPWPAETLKFDGLTRKRQWTTTGVGAWNIQLHLTYKSTGWNKLFNPKVLETNPTEDAFQRVGYRKKTTLEFFTQIEIFHGVAIQRKYTRRVETNDVIPEPLYPTTPFLALLPTGWSPPLPL